MTRDRDTPRLRLVPLRGDSAPSDDAATLHLVPPRSNVIPLRPAPEPPDLRPDDPPRGAA